MDPHAQLETAEWSHADAGMIPTLDAEIADWVGHEPEADDDGVDALDAQILAGLVSP